MTQYQLPGLLQVTEMNLGEQESLKQNTSWFLLSMYVTAQATTQTDNLPIIAGHKAVLKEVQR